MWDGLRALGIFNERPACDALLPTFIGLDAPPVPTNSHTNMLPLLFHGTSPQLSLTIAPAPFIAIATLILYLRFWVRRQKKQKLGADDFFSLAALIVTYGEYTCMILVTVFGGHTLPATQIPPENLSFARKVIQIILLVYIIPLHKNIDLVHVGPPRYRYIMDNRYCAYPAIHLKFIPSHI